VIESTPTRLQFSLQEILAWTAVFALALSLLMIWEFPWLAVLSIGVGGYLVGTIGRRRAAGVTRFGDWLGLFAGYLLLGSGPYVALVEGNSSSSWTLPLVMPFAPVLRGLLGWTVRSFYSLPEAAILATASCIAYLFFASLTMWRPRLRWAFGVLFVVGFALNFSIFRY